ncbi:hypothetical protein BD779DRAFT_1476024, partial [Infundibulicybe gibba]
MTVCPGCTVHFSSRGFSQHILTTTNPACMGILERSLQAAASYPHAPGDDWETDNEMEVDPQREDPPQPDTSDGANGGADNNINMAPIVHKDNQSEHGNGVSDEDEDEFLWGDEEDDEGGVVRDDYDALESDGDEEFWPLPEVPGDLDSNQPPPPAQPPQPAGGGASTTSSREPRKPFVEMLESSRAGEPLPQRVEKPGYSGYRTGPVDSENPWAPFNSKLDWELARWAKLRGPGSTAVSDLLGIDGFQDKLGLSYKNSRELNQIIDTQLPNDRPRFERGEIKVAGEAFDIYYRDPLKCVKALFADPECAGNLLLRPERHFTDASKEDQLYHEMNTGRWWWDTQQTLDRNNPGGTIIPVIISSDKTQVTVFGSKQAYPVYLTISNIPKNIRRKPSRPGINGKLMASGDGVIRRNHPILAVYTGDYPEQLLVTGIKSTSCPKCKVTKKDLGNPAAPLDDRNLEGVLQALALVDDDPLGFAHACKQNGIKPVVHPFWEDLPYVYQGIVKHLISWIEQLYGRKEIDERCKRFPPNHHIRLFMNGISSLSRVTGREHSQMCSFLLGLIAESPSLSVSRN